MEVLYRTVSRESDGWHVESVGEDGSYIEVFATRAEALAFCAGMEPPPDFAEGGLIAVPMLDGEGLDDD